MIFHSLCFSLAAPEKNEYVYMLLLLIQSLLKTKTFVPKEDTYYVMADKETAAILKQIPQSQFLYLIEIPRPRDVYEGMTYKYKLFDFVETRDEVVMYLDVDLLAVKQSRFVIPPDKLYICAEGSKSDTNYSGDDSTTLPFNAGYTAGFFMYRWGPRVSKTFTEILERMANCSTRFYTLDQPHFNRALGTETGVIGFFPATLLSFNGHNNQQAAHFINLAGEPGDGPFHFRKALSMYLMLF